MKFLQWLKMVLRRFRAQGVHYIGGSDVLPPPLSPEERPPLWRRTAAAMLRRATV